MEVDFDLLIVSDGQPALEARVARALSAAAPGRVALLLREPQRTTRDWLALAGALRALTRASGARLLISDRIDIARSVDADGVQLPEAGFPPQEARRLLGQHALIGVSRHSRQGLLEAAQQGADYATLSPVHAVDGKAPPLGIAGFAAAITDAPLPVYALGGVRAEDVAPLLASGARGVAVIREVLAAADPALSTRRLLALLVAV